MQIEEKEIVWVEGKELESADQRVEDEALSVAAEGQVH